MTAVAEIVQGACPIEPVRDRDLEREIKQVLGQVPHPVGYFARCPWLVRALVLGNLSDGLMVHTDIDLSERIWLAVSQDNSCRYCYAAHRAFLRILGLPEAHIRRLEQDLYTAELNPRERLAIEFSRRVSRADPPLSSADKKPLRDAGYTEEEIKELAFVAAYIAGVNRSVTIPAIPPEPIEAMPDTWKMRLMRPFAARKLRSMRRRGQRISLTPEEKQGPYSYLVVALDGLPIARMLRNLLDAALDSPILPRRAKLLVFAVVSRGLSCEFSEREAARLLDEEGLGRESLAEVLANLASPALDAMESRIVPFARETIWYQTETIQRRAREMAAGLDPAQFLELVGVAGLANTVSRLGVILDVPH